MRLHLFSAKRKYLSPKVQNGFIHFCELVFRDAKWDRCAKSEFFSVMVNETTDFSETAQLSTNVRYVSTEEEGHIVYDDFIGLVNVDQTDAKTIVNSVLPNYRTKMEFLPKKMEKTGLCRLCYIKCPRKYMVSGKRTEFAYAEAKHLFTEIHRLNIIIVNTCHKVWRL